MSAPTRADIRAQRDEMRGIREERRVSIGQFELREVPNGTGGTNLRFEGYASITCADKRDVDHTYEMEDWIGSFTEGILRGAFHKTLAQNADVCFLVNHGGVTMARTKAGTLKLSEDSTGLFSEALLNPKRSDVQILRAAIEDGALDEMSFAFRVVRQDWDYLEDNGVIDRRWISEVNLDKGDVSAVNYGANPHTGGLVSIRNRVLGIAASVPTGRRSRRAAADACNRCEGATTIDLGAGPITCPQCKGTGTGENNLKIDAATVKSEGAEALALSTINISRARADLEVAAARARTRR